MPPIAPHALEETKPKLVPGTEFLPFNEHCTFLRNQSLGRFLKLSAQEAALARDFDGLQTFSEILHKHASTSGTGHLLNIAELLLYMKTRGFIEDETADSAGEAIVPVFKSTGIISRDIMRLPLKFTFKPLQAIGGFLASTGGLLFLTLVSIVCLIVSSDFKDILIDFNDGSTAGRSVSGVLLFYCKVFCTLWLSICAIVSLKNVLSAYAVAGMGLQPFHPRIAMFCGFFYVDCTVTDIVSRGPLATAKLYGLRLFLPIVVLHCFTALGPLFPGSVLLTTVKKACILVAAFSIMPLIKSDLNTLLYLLTGSTRDFKQSLSYLGKRYFTSFRNFSLKPDGGNDFCFVLTMLTVVWLVIIGKFLWTTIVAGFIYFVGGIRYGFSLDQAYIPFQVLIMLVPFIVLLGMAFTVGASNVQYSLRSPLFHLRSLAGKIGKMKAPDTGIVKSFIKQLPLFSTLTDDQCNSLSARFTLDSYRAGRTILLQGTPGDAFYVIVSGKTRIIIEDRYGVERTVNVLGVGDCFGEIALLENVPRTATVKAMTEVSLLRLDRRGFDEFLAALPLEKKQITDMIRHGKLLMSIPLFSYLSPEQFSYLIAHSTLELFRSGDLIFKQGDAGDKLYIIKDGQVTIRREEQGKPVLEKTLSTGAVFGEIALVKRVPRTAHAAAATDLTLLSVGKEVFYDLVGKSILTGAEIDRLADRRIAEISKSAVVVA